MLLEIFSYLFPPKLATEELASCNWVRSKGCAIRPNSNVYNKLQMSAACDAFPTGTKTSTASTLWYEGTDPPGRQFSE